MINTTIEGTPCNSFDGEKYKFVVRTFYLESEDMYVTDVYYLKDEEYYKHINVTIQADKKEDILSSGHFSSRYYLQEVCNHRPLMYFSKGTKYEYTRPNAATPKRLGELHMKVCKEILDGEYWFGYIAIP